MGIWTRNRRRVGYELPPSTFSAANVAEYYDEWNGRYEAVFGDVFQHLQAVDRRELFDHMADVAGVVASQRALDAGCGICGPAIEFVRRGAGRIEAATISAVQADRARSHVAEAGLAESIEVSVVDFHNLSERYRSDSFDLVYFLESLVHAHDPQLVLAEVAKVLEPGGRLYIKDFYRGRSDDPTHQRVIDECVAATNEICHLTIRDTAQMLDWVASAGFDIVVSQPLAVSHYSIEAGHEFCSRYGLDVAAGRDFRTTFYLDNLEILAVKRA